MTRPLTRSATPAWRRTSLLLVMMLMIAGIMLAPGPTANAKTPPPGLGGFEAGNLISDSRMFDGDAMTTAQVDAFLDKHGAKCGSNPLCLANYTASTPKRAATKYCAALPAGTKRTAGRIITDVAVACDINPEVLLTMLQKEQGLITTTSPTKKKLDQALGFGCPDFLGCDPKYAGFAQQIYNAGNRLQEYGDPKAGYTFRAGGTYQIQYSPYAFCGAATVKIANRATAALYNYTPFTPTQAALDAGASAVVDDVCASYGNRNFFRNHSQWFGTPNGAAKSRYPVAAPMGTVPKSPFDDVVHGRTIFFTEIAWMAETGLSNGWPDGTYRPLVPVKRDAIAAFLYRAAGSPAYTPPKVSPFKDISARDTIFYKEISWAHEMGIAEGWPDGTFRPYENAKRDAMAAFLYRASGSPSFTPPARSPFVDVTRTKNSIFYKEITWAHSEGITTGWSNRTFQPLSEIKRDAIAAFVYRMTLD